MSSGELLVIVVVAIIVFGPDKLPMLANHLGKFYKQINQFKQQLHLLWQNQLNEQQLVENQRKARQADNTYLHTTNQNAAQDDDNKVS